MAKRFKLRPGTQLLFMLIGLTVLVWVLRGFGVLTFIPGIVIWLLLLLCFAVFIFNSFQAAR
ncbi:MAG: hypothetical protein AAFQ61_10110 [Cyanobacteria bacterium J06626_23]